jgi:pyruvate/2-oxoglutarate dehydrogenase complex dihydrolipoamide dehydrogenase (E3) component
VAKVLTPDLCIVGAGAAGLSVAAAAGMMQVPTVLVEKGEMGGDCLNHGCVPSKALIAAGKLAHGMRHAGDFGLAPHAPEIDLAAVQAHVRQVIAAIAPNDSAARFGALGVQVIRAAAHFTDPRTLVAGDTEIRARRFVLATGSKARLPDIPGLAEAPYLTNETLFLLTERPQHLAIIGGGPVGMEMAQAHRRLGIAVTLLQSGRVLAREEEEAAALVAGLLRREGVTIHENARVTSVSGVDGQLTIRAAVNGEAIEIEASHLLVAAGRKVTTEGLGLEAARIAFNETGIVVDKGLRTTNRRVYCIGDAVGGPQFTHVANYHAGLVLRDALFRLPVKADHAHVPRVTFTDPEVASVGLSEAEARKQAGGMRALRWPMAENDRAQADRKIEGFVKAVVDKKGRILGVTIVAANAGELILPWQMAMRDGERIQRFTGLTFAYPTASEATKRVATAFLLPQLRGPWLQRALRLLRRLG